MRRASALIAGLLACGAATAGGPLAMRANGEPFLWSTSAAIPYRTDNGPLSATVTQSQAQARVRNMFDAWQDVASAAISYSRAGFISDTPGFSDGDVSTAAEFNAAAGDCEAGDQSPIMYDANGDIVAAIIGDDSVIGFAGPCAVDTGQGLILSGLATMNGLFQDGIENGNNFEITAAEFNAAFVHEFGHFSGLDHSQVNVDCAFFNCAADDRAGLPTMFPFLVGPEQGTLSIDDVGWISKLYPAGGAGGFAATHGTITGAVLYSDGESHVQVMNVIARRVDTGGNQDRRLAASAVSGYRFRLCTPNPITNQPLGDCPAFGITDAKHLGSYEISVPPGNYTVEVEAIDPTFTQGSGVGPLEFEQRPLPGTAPPPVGPITVTAGQTTAGHDVVLIGTPPRFDQFEGP